MAAREEKGRGMARRTSQAKIFVLQKVQPALLGLMDGAVSTLAPIFAAAGLTGKPASAFFVGLAASLGAGISMGLAEALSDDGEITGRGGPLLRGAITGFATAAGGMLHTFPFLISNLPIALHVAYGVVVIELLSIAFIRYRYMHGNLWTTIGQVVVGGGIVFGVGLLLGRIGAHPAPPGVSSSSWSAEDRLGDGARSTVGSLHRRCFPAADWEWYRA